MTSRTAGLFNGMMRCALLLMLCFVQQIVGPAQFDPENCSEASPCCVSSDDTLLLLGSFSTTFCKIEYPVRSTVQWNKSVAMRWDKQARRMVKNLTALQCDPEACTVKPFPRQFSQRCALTHCDAVNFALVQGYACAEMFPRCFYVNATTQV